MCVWLYSWAQFNAIKVYEDAAYFNLQITAANGSIKYSLAYLKGCTFIYKKKKKKVV